jgi:hypothetical protein
MLEYARATSLNLVIDPIRIFFLPHRYQFVCIYEHILLDMLEYARATVPLTSVQTFVEKLKIQQ